MAGHFQLASMTPPSLAVDRLPGGCSMHSGCCEAAAQQTVEVPIPVVFVPVENEWRLVVFAAVKAL